MTDGYSCVNECPRGWCRDNEQNLCRKCSENPYTRGSDSKQFFSKTDVLTLDNWVIQESSVNLNNALVSLCTTGYLENKVVNIIGGKSIFSANTVMSKNYTNLPPHYQIRVDFMAFLIDLGADASTVTDDLIVKLDLR